MTKITKNHKDLTVTLADAHHGEVVSITLPWTSTLYLTKDEATWLGVTLYQLLTAQETDAVNPPPDQL